MHQIHSRRLVLLLSFYGWLISGCTSTTPATPADMKSAQSAPSETVAAPARPVKPAEKPHKAEDKKPAPVTHSAPAAQPSVAPAAPSAAPVPVAVPEPLPAPPPAPAPAPIATEPPPQPAAPIFVVDTKDVTIPAGTEITVRMIDSVDSSTAHVGDTFRASVDLPVLINNDVVLQKGADVSLKLTQISSAGALRGKSELQLALDRIFVGKKSYALESNVFENSGADQDKKAVRNGVIGAAIGAAIGAIAGGGKGAAIGAGAGAGGGVGTTVLMKGEQVRVPSETRLLFTLKEPVSVTVPPGLSPTQPRQNFPSPTSRFEVPRQQTQPDDERPRVRRRN